VQQKVSASSRSEAGGAAFARQRSYVSTLRKQGQALLALLAALETLLTGQPLTPAFA
jgi:hypothetical protein